MKLLHSAFSTTLFLSMLLLPLSSNSETLHIGSIADEYVAEVTKFKPLTDYLTPQLAPHGIDRIEVVVTNSMEKMSHKLKQGEVDLFIDSPYPAIVVSQQSGSHMALRRWKQGIDAYHSVIFVRKEQPITTIEALKGKQIAFEEPFSTASYFLGKSELIRHGLQPVEGDGESNTPNQIRYHFSGEDSTTVAWVLRRRTEAGTLNHHKFNAIKPKMREQLKVIHRSPSVPRHIVSFRKDLPQPLVEQISSILITMEQSAAGRESLLAFQKTRKFDPIPVDDQATLEQLKRLVEEIH